MKRLFATKTIRHPSLAPTYASWKSMRQRCSNPMSPDFKNYGARGISVCERWDDFANFLADMGERPDEKTLERRNNDGNYEPGNCLWEGRLAQARNRSFVRPLTLNGRTQLLTDWASELGTKPNTISMRIDAYGWTVERALTTPVRRFS